MILVMRESVIKGADCGAKRCSVRRGGTHCSRNNTVRLVMSRKAGGVIKFCNKHSSDAVTHFGNAESGELGLKRSADTQNSRSKY